jgi:DNA-directed RNA polymerase specialized sigma24 family protein
MFHINSTIARLWERDDFEVVRQVLGGAREEYLVLLRRHFFAVYARVYARLGARAEASAVAREAFLETYRRLDTLGPEERFEDRVWAVAKERCKHPPAGIGVEADSEAFRGVRRAFLGLDEGARLAVMLRYGAGRSMQAVAELCGVSPRDVGRLLKAAEEHLGAARPKDVVAAVAPTVSVEDVAREALLEPVSWRISAVPARMSRRRLRLALGFAGGLLAGTVAGALFVSWSTAAVPVPPPAPIKTVEAPPLPAPASAPADAPSDKTGSVEGRVLDAVTEEPLSEFELAHPSDKDAQGKPVFVKTSDPDGRFYLGGLAPGATQIMFRAPGHAESVTRFTVPDDIGEPLEIEVRLERSRSVQGVVKDASGRPVAEAMFFAGEIPFPFVEGRELGRSDADGHFRAEGVPSVATSLSVYHPEYAAAFVPLTDDLDEIVDVKLVSGGRVEGTLKAAGEPLVNANVRAATEDGSAPVVSGYTDDQGHFALAGVPTGTIEVAVNWSDTRRAERPVTLEAGGRAQVDIDFAPGVARVEGRVTQRGETVQYAELEAQVRSENGDLYTGIFKASSEGWFRTDPLPPGKARLFVMAITGDSRMRRKMVEVAVPESGTLRQDVDFKERATLQGTLEGLEGDKHARVYVLWSRLERQPMTRAQLDEVTKNAVARQFLRQNGPVRIDSLEPGRYTLFAIALADESPQDFAEAQTAVTEVTVGGKDASVARLELK